MLPQDIVEVLDTPDSVRQVDDTLNKVRLVDLGESVLLLGVGVHVGPEVPEVCVCVGLKSSGFPSVGSVSQT